MKTQKKVLRRDHTDAKKVQWRNELLEQFHEKGLTQEQLMMSAPKSVVRVLGKVIPSGPRNKFLKGDSFKIRNPKGLK